MTSRDRSIVYYLFTLAFFIISPIVLLYASGYEFDSIEGRVQQSGMILLDVVPEDARVLLNTQEVGNANRSRGAIRVPGLADGTYAIHIEKEGYFPWSTTLSVRAGAVAAPSTIRLIRTTQSFLTLPFPFELARTSPNEELLAGVIKQSSTRTLILFSTRAGNAVATIPLPTIISTPQNILWSPDSQKIAIIEKRPSARYVTVYDYKRNVVSTSLPILPLLTWESRSETLLNSDGTTIRRILPFSQQSSSATLPSPIIDVVSVEDHVYALTQTTAKTLSLIELQFTTNTTTTQTLLLKNTPLPAGSKLLSVPNFPLIVKTPTLLLLLERSNAGIWHIAEELPSTTLSRITPREIITMDSNTLYRYTPDHILSSTPLESVINPRQLFPIPSSPWIALSADHTLFLYKKPLPKDTVGQSAEPMIRIDESIETQELITDPSGRLLIFMGTKDGQSGLFIRLLTDSSAGPFGGR